MVRLAAFFMAFRVGFFMDFPKLRASPATVMQRLATL